MVMKLKFIKRGGHYHCRLFTADALGYTWAKCGEVVFNEREWESVRLKFKQIAIVEPEEETQGRIMS